MSAISVSHLVKDFQVHDKQPGLMASIKSVFHRPHRLVKAVNDVSFDIAPGELVGFIGPNGAGKTTTLKCLTGLLYPSSGHLKVLGFTPYGRDYNFLRQIGFVMGSKNQLWWDLPPQETFLLNQAIYDIPRKEFTQKLDFFYDTLKIGDIVKVQTKKLSLGQRMKCEFVAALLHSPRVIFLDEPTIGLDVVASRQIRQFIRQYNRQYRATIILTSHNMTDVQQLCSRVIVINHGQIYYDGLLSRLSDQISGQKYLEFVFHTPVKRQLLQKYGHLVHHSLAKSVIRLDKSTTASVASDILSHFPVADLNINEVPIEDVISKVFGARQ